MKTIYVLRYVRDGNGRPANPDHGTHYLYKSVGTDLRYGSLVWRVTPDVTRARTWATRKGAERFCTRLHEQFVVEEVAA